MNDDDLKAWSALDVSGNVVSARARHLLDHAPALAAEVLRLREALRHVEWSRGTYCGECGHERADGHGCGCTVANALAATRGRP